MQEEEAKYKKSILWRYVLIGVAVLIVSACIVGKAAYTMFVNSDYWMKIAERYVKENMELLPTRGNIISADGKLMASSLPEYRIFMDFGVESPVQDSILSDARAMDTLCEGMHRIIPECTKEYFARRFRLGRQKKARYWPLYAKRISFIQYKELLKLPLLRLGRYTSGLTAEELYRRKKPFGSLASATLGTIFPEAERGGRSGLELAYDSILRGENGIYHRQKVKNKYLNVVDKPAVDGADLITTIDVSMQDIAEKALVDKLREFNAYKGIVIIMETKTGDVKAIVNMQEYSDGNYFEGINFAVSDMMEPGSTFKTASMMVALEDGVVTIHDSVDTGNGQHPMHGSIMRDHNWRRGGYQWLTVPGVLMKSSNIGISRIIDEHYFSHPQDYVDGLYKLGINADLGLPFVNAGRAKIRRPNKENWWKTTLAWMSIGYETQIPPINTVTFYNAIANGGRMMKPRFVKGVARGGTMVQEFPPEVLRERICSQHTLDDIRMILRRVVSEGLGKPAGSKQFSVSGKTGTAQVSQGRAGYKAGRTHYLLSFCGYFPSENPEYTMLVSIQKAGLPASGGLMSGSIFHNIAERIYAKHLSSNLNAARDTLPPAPRRLPRKSLAQAQESDSAQVPNVRGLTLKDAAFLLRNRGLKVQAEGTGRVKAQSLPAGSPLRKGETIILTLTSPSDAKIKPAAPK